MWGVSGLNRGAEGAGGNAEHQPITVCYRQLGVVLSFCLTVEMFSANNCTKTGARSARRHPCLKPGTDYNTKGLRVPLRSKLKLPFSIIKAKLGRDLNGPET